MKARYYEAELAYLREQGRELAQQYPRTAGLLAERSDDPDVERLLEGFAFLVAAVRERIDDEVPELARGYAGVLAPQLTRFVPPLSMIEFRPQATGLRVAEFVDRGATVSGTGASGVSTPFRTTSAVRLMPITLEGVEEKRPVAGEVELVMSFRASEQRDAGVGVHPIRLHFHGELQQWQGLRTWFLEFCDELVLERDGEVVARFPGSEVRPAGGEDEASLFPERTLEFDAFTRVAEFFAFPAKFAFVDLPPLGADARGEFKLVAHFSGPPKLPKVVSDGDIRLHCTPVINLFESDLEPVTVDPLNPSNLLRVAGFSGDHSEVWEVTEVVGVGTGVKRTFHPFTSAGAGERTIDSFFATRTEFKAGGVGTQRYITLLSSLGSEMPSDIEVLSMRGLCSNRALACELGIGQLNEPHRGPAAAVPFSNIRPVSPPLYPQDRVELLWRLGAHMSLSRKALLDATSLRSILSMYNFASSANPSLAKVNSRWIQAIKEVRYQSCVRLIVGAPVTGTRTTVVLDGTHFASQGEAYVFGELLDDMFSRRVGINSFNVFTVEVAPSGAKFSWKPKNALAQLP